MLFSTFDFWPSETPLYQSGQAAGMRKDHRILIDSQLSPPEVALYHNFIQFITYMTFRNSGKLGFLYLIRLFLLSPLAWQYCIFLNIEKWATTSPRVGAKIANLAGFSSNAKRLNNFVLIELIHARLRSNV